MGVTREGRDVPSLQELRAGLIPTQEASSWDEGELPRAVLDLEDHTSLSRCDVLLRLSCVARRSLDETKASRAAALREILIELLGEEVDHLSCRVLRALAGLEPGTGGRDREERQRIAGLHLGSVRQPASSRTVRRYARQRCWVWLLDRLVELEVRERKAGSGGELEQAPSAGWGPPPEAGTAGVAVLSSQPRDDEDGMDRREFLQGAGKLTGALLAAVCLESAEVDRQLEVSDVGPATLERLDRAIERFGREYPYRPPAELLAEVRAWRQYVVRLLQGRHTLAQRRHLYGAAGWLSSLLGSLTFDLGHEPAAGAHQATALHLAREAGHDQLAAWVYGDQAKVAVYTGHPEQAVAFARAGQELAPAGSVDAVRLFSLEARGHARMGNRASFQHAVGRATEIFDRLPSQSGGGIFWFAPEVFPYYGGSSYLWLGQPRRAMEQAEQAIDLFDATPADWPDARVIARIDLATALLQLQEVEDACAMGAQALDIYASGRRCFAIRRAAELRSALQEQGNLPAVREFEERFCAVCGDQQAGLS